MHSIAVFGDARTHFIDAKMTSRSPETGEEIIEPFRGVFKSGVYMTSAAILYALRAIGRPDLPKVFSYDSRKQAADEATPIGDFRSWQVTHVSISGLGDTRSVQRLRTSGSRPKPFGMPILSPEFLAALRPGGVFEPPSTDLKLAQFQVPYCPDIVVFHDLGVFLRQLNPSTDLDPEEELAKLVSTKRLGSGPDPKTFELALQILIRRLDKARQHAESHFLPCMEPVIICPVKCDIESILPLPNSDLKTLWTHLKNQDWFRKRTILVLDAADLRVSRRALAISTGLSWERTAQDTIFELRRNNLYKGLFDFGQVIIRYGVTGALHIVRRGSQDWSFKLHFDPAFDDLTWSEPEKDGVVIGYSSVFVATLVQALTKACYDTGDKKGLPLLADLHGTISDAVSQALLRCQKLSHGSYGHQPEELFALQETHWLPANIFSDSVATTTPFALQQIEVPPVLLRNWSILSQSAQVRIGRVARRIVSYGVDRTLNQPPPADQPHAERDAVVAPVVQFGKLTPGKKDKRIVVVDRREIEGFRAIQKLMRAHVENIDIGKKSRPLSIAVFGPPGSGKSYAVDAIINSLGNAPRQPKPLPPYNLAQFADAKALENAFAEIARACIDDQIPVAFFDEFDCRGPGNEEFPWLKLFLAPMEDGYFRQSNVKNAIFVFAGGTSTTFSDFSLENRSITDPQWLAFSKAKGPDFVSRLRGHLNIVGINSADPDDELYLIRRAILIRAFLADLQDLRPTDKARIDPNMLRAVLHVPEYRHGGRSLRMLLASCQSSTGQISLSAVPPIHQLNMLVDGKAFLDLAMNVSADEADPKNL